MGCSSTKVIYYYQLSVTMKTESKEPSLVTIVAPRTQSSLVTGDIRGIVQ